MDGLYEVFGWAARPQRGAFDSLYLTEAEVAQFREYPFCQTGTPRLTNLATLCEERRVLRRSQRRAAVRGAVLEDLVTTLERRPYSRAAVAAVGARAREVLAATSFRLARRAA